MSTDTATTRLSEREVAEHFSDVLDRVAKGERIIIEREGAAFAIIEPAPPAKLWTWGELVHFLKYEASFDEDFARNVREVRDSQSPARAAEWPD